MTETLLLLIPLSIAVVFAIGLLFWWGIRRGQFDDLDNPGRQILQDDDRPSAGAMNEGGDRPQG